LKRTVELLAACCLLARYWPPEGSGHHDAARIVGGFLSRAGLTPERIETVVEAIAKAAGSARWQELKRTAKDAAKAHDNGGKAYGLAALREAFTPRIANRVAEWLAYSGDTGRDSGATGTDSELDELNKRYSIVTVGSGVRIMDFLASPPVFHRKTDFE